MADTLRLHVGKVRLAPPLAALLLAGAPALSTAQGPAWNWARSMDAGGDEYVRDVAVEPVTGNIYVAGAYQTATALVAPYSLPASNGGSVDAFLAKLDPNGNLLWSRSIGSAQDDAAMGVAVSSSGLVVVTGSALGSIPAIGLTNTGSSDAFVAAYNASGTYQWAKFIAGPQWDEGTGVVCTGNLVVSYGTYSYHTLLGGVLSALGLTVGRYYAYLNAYDQTGALQWSLTGVSDDDVLSERIAADATNVYVVGRTDGNTMGWRNSLGVTTTNASTSNDNALYCTSVTLAGTPGWTRMINNPGDSDAECNGVAVGCDAVYITGHTHDGSVFPGGMTRTVGGVHDYWFLASLDRTTGTSNWVRTASSDQDHGADGYDVAVGRNGQVHVSGALNGTVTTDMGTVITGSGDEDIMIARFNTDGTAVWTRREVSSGDERALAIASSGGGTFVVGGWYEDGLTLGTASHPGTNGSNLFTASFTDPDWTSIANNPARFAQPGPFCLSSAPVDLNAYLAAYADTAIASLNVLTPQEATGAPNSVGATFSTTGGWMVLDLLDTLPIGEALSLTWRSQTNLVQARMLVSTSIDMVNWTAPTTYTTSSSSYGITYHVLGAAARYVKVARHSSLGTAFQLDAVRFFGSTVTGGTWSGGAYVTPAGLFNPSAAGSYSVTYTVVQGQCTFSHTRTIVVHAPAVGGTLAGGGTFCPGTSGTLTLGGHSGQVLRWERSTNGTTWFPVSNTTTTQTWSGFTGTMHLRVVVDGGACGTALSSTATLIVEDVTPPVASCPPSDTLHVTSGSCTAPYTMPLIASTDNCLGVLLGGPVQITIGGGGPVAVNGIPVQADLDLSLAGGSIIDLPLGTHQFTDTIFDGNGNKTVCAWTITVIDTIAPVITCPATIDLPAGISCKAVLPDVTGQILTLFDNCTDTMTIDQNIPMGNNVVAGDIIIITATDSSGNTSACPMLVVTIDTIAPVFDNCPGPLTANTDPNSCEHLYTFPAIESTDHCDTDTESDYRAFILESGNTLWQDVTGQSDHAFSPGLHQLMEVHRDDAGNQDTCFWSLNVIDANPPAITCPAIVAQLSVGTGCTVGLPDYTGSATVTGNCSGNAGVVVTQSPAAGIPRGPGTHMITLTATLGTQSATCSFPVSIIDNTAPAFVNCPVNISVNAGSNACDAQVTWNPPTVNDNCPGATVTQTGGQAPGSTFAIGTHIITYTALDAANNPSSCSFTVTVNDATAPVFTFCPSDIAVEATAGLCGAAVTYTLPATSDCGMVTISRPIGPASGSVFPVGTTLVRHRAVDNAGNSTECNFWVTVFDATAPTLQNCPSNIPASAGANCAAVVNYATPTITEPCTTCNTGVPVGYTALGTYQGRTYYYRNSNSSWLTANNSAIAAGGHLPVIRDAAHNAWLRNAVDAVGGTNQNFWIGLNDIAVDGIWRWTNSAPVTYANWDTGEPNNNPTPSGNEDYAHMKGNGKWNDEDAGVSMRSVIEIEASCLTPMLTSGAGTASGSSFPLGTTTVSFSSTDAAGNTSSCTFNVNVQDTEPATISCPADTILYAYSDTCTATYLYDTPTISDNCGGPWSALLVSGLPPGEFPLDTTTTVYSGSVAGQTLTCEFTVIVVDAAPPIVHCPLYDSLQLFLNADCELIWPNLLDSITVDDCSSWTRVMWPPADTVITQPGVYPMTMDFTDALGYTTPNNHLIWVRDTIAPTIIGCPTDISMTTTQGECDVVVSWTEPSASDNCGATLTRSGPASGSAFPIGTTTITYTATDGTRSVSCSFNVVVTAPVVDLGYAVTTICQSSAPILPSIVSPPGGVFSDANQTNPPTIDPVTGEFNPAVATPGPHALGYVFAGGCTSHDWFTINVVAAPDATIAYDASPYCSTAGSASVTLTGTPGGTYSSTSGLMIDAGSGEVDLGASTPGTYVVSYFVAATAVCPSSISTTAITITEVPNASVNYPGTAFCTEGTWVSPVIGGSAIGEFIADPVISTLNATTGAFNPGNTIAGNYMITYRWDATGGCAADSILIPIEVHDAVWSGNDATASLCMSSTWFDLNTLATGANGGGTWKKSSGLIVPGGIINPSLATPGTYTYWYITHGTAPCTDDTASFLITYTAPGTTCDDGLATTGNDTWDANCVCVGELIDCEGNAGGSALPGTPCDDGLATTGSDTWNTNCTCVGQLIDCEGNAGGSALPGTPCDDGLATTSNDTWDVNCTCVGQLIDCEGNAGGPALPGTPCDDGLATTGNDTWDVNCLCTGQLIDCAGVPNGTAAVDACGVCAGGTTGITPNGSCADCAGVPNGTAAVDACGVCAGGTTGITPNSSCADCAGVPNGAAAVDACGVCSGGNTGIVPNSSCADCAGVPNGTAAVDACGVCSGGNTGIVPNSSCADCAGVPNGTAAVDACGVCAGGTTGITPNSSCVDCAGVPNGTAAVDACGVCAGGTTGITPNSSCADCAGVPNGAAAVDACGVCSGGNTGIVPNSSCADCAGVPNGTAAVDACGVCAGGTTGITPNSSCADCAGVPNGTAAVDACGVCAGGTTGITPNSSCADCAGVPNGAAAVDACGVCSGGNTGIVPNSSCADCAGVPNGTAAVDACGVCAGGTTGITPNSSCADCAGVPNGTAAVDACGVCSGGNTGIVPNSSCADCAGVPNGTAAVDACGVCSGGNTGIVPNSSCADCAGVPNGTAAVDACGVCAGGTTGITPNGSCADCAGVPNGTAAVDACGVCAGGTTGITPNSSCADCAGVPNGAAAVDACGVCSGGNTGIVPNSSCADCAGVPNGTAAVDACGVCAGGTTGITPNSSCVDCAGVPNGTAAVDACGVCAGGTTGITPNSSCADCAGVPNGAAAVDACGVCSGGNTGIVPNSSCADCAGVPNGTAAVDACGVCSGGNTGIVPNSSCADCAGVPNGTAAVDACGVCAGGTTGITPNSSCADCAGVPNGTAAIDACGVCAGGTTGITPNSSCADCAGVPNGTAAVDACGVCAGGTTGITPNSSCADCAGVPNGTAAVDACGVCASGTTGITPNSSCADCAGVPNGTAAVDACGVCAGGTTGVTPNSFCADCLGVPGGSALPGTACDDGDTNTGNDVYGANCVCAGQLIDCLGVPGGSALPGTTCDDGNPNSTNDVYDANCTCSGTLANDCFGVPGGPAQPGTVCDDGLATTGNDLWDANCVCVGQLIDCLGVPGGSALPGTACNDGNANTGNDTWDASCVCTGQPIDCLGVPGGSALPGTACDDGDTNTGNDVYDANCVCVGQLIDCLGVPGGSALPGTACDDGDTNTGNDVYDANCVCVGQLIDCLGVPGGSALPGTACNDGNANTGNDVYDANCVCAGQLIDCLGVPGGSALPGTACDDGDTNTGNDVYDANCVCAGQLIDCLGVPGGSALPGTACDDGDTNTGNDVYDAICVCAGQLIDCLGVPGGSALPGTACNDGNANTGNDVYDANCVCAGQLIDCLGVPGGSALPGTACNDGNANTGNDVYDANCVCAGQLIDCLGVPGGSALPGTTCDDGNPNSTNDVYDANCTCSGTLANDCFGVPGGPAQPGTVCDDGLATTGNDLWDANCVCVGQLIDCLGVPGGSALPGTACNDGNANTGNDTWDASCVCAGQLIDCLGVPGGSALPGTACDDGDTNTGNDVYDANCVCAGQMIDCLGVPGGSALPGTACNDGNANSTNDVYDANCTCSGTLANDCFGVPGGPAQPGTVCDDGLATTGNDLWDANCVCVGQLIDCLGVPGGSALPGTACNDGNANTGNDTWDASCVCAGQLIDCLGVPGGSALPGTACDDGDTNTGNDVYGANCVCAGELIDCLGVPGGSALPGTACNDGNANTGNDTWDASCVCAGQLIDCLGVPGGSALPGTACDDGNANTGNDVYDANCVCAGQPIDCLGVPGGSALTGTACDDGNANTGNDTWDANCVCAGQLIDCLGVPGGSALPGTACDDGNANTGNDVYDANCVCAGQLIDCLGVPGGSALPGTACDDGDTNTGNDVYDANCLCAGQPIDCLGVPGGSALPGTACNDGNANTGNDVYDANCVCAGQLIDCLGVPGGSALPGTACDDGDTNTGNDVYDANCLCAGQPIDCLGVPGGSALPGTACNDGDANTGNDVYDANCVCAGQPIDCLGVPGGTALPGTACDDGNANTGNDTWDANCVCAGQLIDCLGVPGGSALTGTACDDGNANTVNDVYDANCTCLGIPLPNDCLGVPGGSALPGTACDDGDACTANDTWDANCICVGVPIAVDASFDYAQSAYCETNGSVTPWAADPNGTYLGSPGLVIDPTDGTVDIGQSSPGLHIVTHSIGGACPAVSIDTLTIDTMPSALWNQPGSICAQQGPLDLAAFVVGTPGGDWSGTGISGTNFEPGVGPGSYAVTYTVANGSCTADLEQLILVTPGPLADAGSDTTICGTVVQLQALVLQAGGTWSGPAGCLFDDPTSSNTNVAVPSPGSYTFLWTVGQAPCIAVDSVTVEFHEPGTSLFVDAGEDQELAVVTNTTLSGQIEPGAQVLWTRFSGDGHLATPDQPVTDVLGLALGTNTFVLTASLPGCATASDTVQVSVLDVFVPQGFSPNGDGVNDRFEVTGIEAFPANELKVFDRWGRPVFAQRGYDNSWDGRGGNGIPLIDDTYFFVLNLDEERTYNGYLIIKR